MTDVGDISHLSAADEFDALEQNLKQIKAGEIFHVPGEHDVISDNGRSVSRTVQQESARLRVVQFRPEGRALRRMVNVVNIREASFLPSVRFCQLTKNQT